MLNILQLAAGKGSRFSNFSILPKPFISVDGMPMFMRAFTSLGLTGARHHILFQDAHNKKYNPQQHAPDAIIHTIDHYTDGAATSAYSVISNSEFKHEPWLVIDCDFIIDWDKKLSDISTSSIFVENRSWDIKSSYSYIGQSGNIECVAEKQPISNYRNTGHYLWESGNLFSECYEFSKDNNLTILNEFYMAPLYNIAIQRGYKVAPTYVERYVPIGTPEDLKQYNEK